MRGLTILVAPNSAALSIAALLVPAFLNAQTLDTAIEHHLAGRLDAALAAYQAVASTNLESDPVGSGIAHNNACMILMDRGEYESALEHCEAARPLFRDPDLEDLRAQNLNNLGVVYQNLARFEEAENDLRQAMALNRGIEAWEGVVINVANLGALAMVRGYYGEALDLHRSAERLAMSREQEPWAAQQVRIARINQGVVWEKLGEHRQALSLFRDTLSAREPLTPRRSAAIHVNVGVIYRNLGDPVRAAEEIVMAIAEYQGTGDRAGLSNAFLNLGLVQYLNLDALPEAELSVRQALSLSRQSGAVTEEIQDLFYLGWILLASSNDVEAEHAFRECYELAESTGSAEGQWSSLVGLARVRSFRGDLGGALRLLRQAMDRVEEIRSRLDEGLRAGFFGDKRPIYAAAIRTLWGLHQANPGGGYDRQAYAIAQRAKARTLLDTWGFELLNIQPASAAAVQERLGTDLLLEYFLGTERGFLWVLQRDSLLMVDLGPAGTMREQVLELVRALAAGETLDDDRLGSLGARLVGPAEAELTADRRLRVAPDGVLAHVPFALLPAGRFGGAIIELMTVSMTPSGSMLTKRAPSPSSKAVRFLGYADVDTDSARALESTDGRELLAQRFDLRPLPSSAAELANAAAAMGGRSRLITGSDATEASFRSSTAAGARVLHIATHAILDARSTGGSAIVLTPAGQDDGLLYAREVAGLTLRVDLAVLAACRTGIGTGFDTSGVSSLTGAFLAAGASSVIATLWDVDDAATAAFMQQFYYFLARGVATDTALRSAQLRLIGDTDWNRPQVWAAFVVTGQGDTVVASPSMPWWMLWMALATALVAALLRSRRRHRE